MQDMQGSQNRRNYDPGGVFQIVRRTARAVPVFMVASIVSCLFGRYIFHVPLKQLGVVAAVPCVMGLIILRILAIGMPADVTKSETHPSKFFRAVVFMAAFAGFIAADFLCSAAIYHRLGLRYLVIGALTIAKVGAGTAFFLVILAVATETSELWHALLMAALKLLRSQTMLIPRWQHKHPSR